MLPDAGVIVGALWRWATVRGSLAAETRDPVYSPFLSLPAIIGMMLAVGLGLHGTEPAKAVFIVFFVLTICFGGWLTGEWVLGEIEEARFHPGYYLPTCAGGFIGAEGCGLFGLQSLGWLSFGLGLISWLILASQVSGRLFFIDLLPAELVPTMAIELASPCVAGAAHFQLHGEVPDPVAYSLAGYAALMLLVQLRLLPIYAKLRFSAGFWSFTFSWCTAAALGIRGSRRPNRPERAPTRRWSQRQRPSWSAPSPSARSSRSEAERYESAALTAASAVSMAARSTSRCVTMRTRPSSRLVSTPAAFRSSWSLAASRTSKMTMLVSTVAGSISTPSIAARPSARNFALAWSSARRSTLCWRP